MTFSLSFSRKPKHDDDDGAAYQRQMGATEAVRRCLDRVEMGSPLLYPF